MQNDSVALQTAKALPYKDLAICIQALLLDHSVFVPPRLVQPLPNGGSLLAAQLLAPNKKGRALIVGTGV